jgi:hypothetical protein
MTLQHLIDMTKIAGHQAQRAAMAASSGNAQAARRAAAQAVMAARDVQDGAIDSGTVPESLQLMTTAAAAATAATEVADAATTSENSIVAAAAHDAAMAGATALAEAWHALGNLSDPNSAMGQANRKAATKGPHDGK